MWSVSKVIGSISLLYLLNFVLCHALHVNRDFAVDSEFERFLLPGFEPAKRIYEKIKDPSDNTINYEEKVFGANGDSDNNYKLFHEYNVNTNNVCLLDNLKKNLLWWAHLNGSLVTNSKEFIMSELCYCFLSQHKFYDHNQEV